MTLIVPSAGPLTIAADVGFPDAPVLRLIVTGEPAVVLAVSLTTTGGVPPLVPETNTNELGASAAGDTVIVLALPVVVLTANNPAEPDK
jgi:hypothetical protein